MAVKKCEIKSSLKLLFFILAVHTHLIYDLDQFYPFDKWGNFIVQISNSCKLAKKLTTTHRSGAHNGIYDRLPSKPSYLVCVCVSVRASVCVCRIYVFVVVVVLQFVYHDDWRHSKLSQTSCCSSEPSSTSSEKTHEKKNRRIKSAKQSDKK